MSIETNDRGCPLKKQIRGGVRISHGIFCPYLQGNPDQGFVSMALGSGSSPVSQLHNALTAR